jgi:hypothetical protein
MATFTKLETAVLRAIFAETPELEDALNQQLAAAIVTKRENTGSGFFTNIDVSDEAPLVSSSRVLGNETYARVEGLAYGLGFVLFMEGQRLNLLEGYACGPEDTAHLNLPEIAFCISKKPFDA